LCCVWEEAQAFQRKKAVAHRHEKSAARKVIACITLRARLCKRDKCGLSWALLTEKCLKFAAALGHSEEAFAASPQWLSNTLKKSQKMGINLHGEAADMDDAMRATIMGEWRKSFHALIENHNLTPDVICNADQTGLHHTKLPHRLHIDKSKRKEHAGVKQMKPKDRITLMVCTSASGEKVPLAIVGKAKKPECFPMLEAMEILTETWNGDGKHAKDEGLMRCWRKANMFPPSWDADVNNEVGSNSMSNKDKKISEEDCDELCGLLQKLIVKAHHCDTSRAVALQGSVVDDLDECSDNDLRAMVTNWMDIEDDEDIIADVNSWRS
jgi:hypothetical protein